RGRDDYGRHVDGVAELVRDGARADLTQRQDDRGDGELAEPRLARHVGGLTRARGVVVERHLAPSPCPGEGYTSRFFTSSAWSSMNCLRRSTSSPIRTVNMRSASPASCKVTRSSTRLVGSSVVSQSCSAFISPRPLKRWT